MPDHDEAELLRIAGEAASAAAGELRARFGAAAEGVHAKSTPTDLVSDADLAAERAVREVIARHRPGDTILGEEGGESTPGDGSAAATSAASDVRWVVDPLDGTVNYLFGIPVFAVSVACEDARGTIAGIVLDPVRDERFTATRSGPAQLDGEVLRAGERSELAQAMVATGFSYDATLRARQAQTLAQVLPRVRDIRRAGAAALDLCWCACGRYDAYYERGLHEWDLAAGALIAERAGLAVRRLPEADGAPWGVLAAPGAILDELYGLVAGEDADQADRGA